MIDAIRPNDLLVIRIPDFIEDWHTLALKMRDKIKQPHIIILTHDNEYKFEWVDHTTPEAIIKLFREEFPWIKITEEGIVL